jgi:predicted small metal-binding protein
MSSHPKAREYERVLDEVQKHAKTLHLDGIRDLLIALIGDPVKARS